ncbi:MAG: UDP-N-acetylmuramate--L-alanine ligase [Spirochaetaceae bacterium]|nr:MAG: UDP-N-acetylmuramate--L-alanine ligase [Spirochaetaceae bacterium]
MSRPQLTTTLSGYRIHLVGIKGTGMTALAEILADRGAVISGSDGPERFYTDGILQRLGIPYAESFDSDHIDSQIQLVVHSAAYDRKDNAELIAAEQKGIPILSYPEALGLLSESGEASGISGTHGKTTTAALTGTILRAWDLPVTVLAGSAVAEFGDRSTLILGQRHFVAETCEYRRHFLHFHPQRIVITAVEADHLDYFRDVDDVLDAFYSFCLKLPSGGQLIVNQDDAGAREVLGRVQRKRLDVSIIPYGRSATGRFRITEIETAAGYTRFRLSGLEDALLLRIPGIHSVYNATAACALSCCILEGEGRELTVPLAQAMGQALEDFRGSRRRSEILGTAGGVLFIDDYGHHPTEIASTLAGLKSFYPERRIIVDFMSHTYSRTKALLKEFGRCFQAADLVVLHRIYASAREKSNGSMDGNTLFREVSRHHPQVVYFEEPMDSLSYLRETLRPGDLFVTMGAGDNWRIGREIFESAVEAAQ